MSVAYDLVPPKAGHVVVGAAWKWDRERKRYRLQQAIYEPRKRREPEPDRQGRARQGLLI